MKNILFALLISGGICAFAADNSDKSPSENAKAETQTLVAEDYEYPDDAIVTMAICDSWDASCPKRMFPHKRHHMARRIMADFFGNDNIPNCPRATGKCYVAECPIARRDAAGNIGFRPNCELSETKSAYKLAMEVPGMTKQDLKITVEDDTLVVSGEKKLAKECRGENYCASERCYGIFERRFAIPEGSDVEGIKASCKNGVLTITIPKSGKENKDSINIKID